MTAEFVIDERITDWLAAEAAGTLPETVFDATFNRVRRTRQRRRSWDWNGAGVARGRAILAILAAASVVAVAIIGPIGLAGLAPPVASPLASSSPATPFPATAVPSPVATLTPQHSTATVVSPPPVAAPRTFSSARLGYSITLSAAWRSQLNPGAWDGVIDGSTHNADAGTDLYVDGADGYLIQIGVMHLKAGTNLARWAADESPRATPVGYMKDPGFHMLTLPIGKALYTHATCPELSMTSVFLIRGTTGVLISWSNLLGDDAAGRAAFLKALGTYR
jgi:hypothetical protein